MKRFLLFFVLVFPFFVSAQEQFSVYFESNKHETTKKQSEILNNWINANKESKVVAINGFTDEDGTNVHNDSLSQRRGKPEMPPYWRKPGMASRRPVKILCG